MDNDILTGISRLVASMTEKEKMILERRSSGNPLKSTRTDEFDRECIYEIFSIYNSEYMDFLKEKVVKKISYDLSFLMHTLPASIIDELKMCAVLHDGKHPFDENLVRLHYSIPSRLGRTSGVRSRMNSDPVYYTNENNHPCDQNSIWSGNMYFSGTSKGLDDLIPSFIRGSETRIDHGTMKYAFAPFFMQGFLIER